VAHPGSPLSAGAAGEAALAGCWAGVLWVPVHVLGRRSAQYLGDQAVLAAEVFIQRATAGG
jgi:hypothetical protein